ncbi:hypothetical protein FG335_14240 [Listeria monocytogenes]|nr:hypothetical protein [Listeria monocytogenes]
MITVLNKFIAVQFKRNWFKLYRILLVVGGIVGGMLFYPKTIDLIYAYLTKHGFNNSEFVGDLLKITKLSVISFFLLALLITLINMLLVRNTTMKSVVIFWLSGYFRSISFIGLLIAAFYYAIEPNIDITYYVWLVFIALVLAYRLIMKVVYSDFKSEYLGSGKFIGKAKPMDTSNMNGHLKSVKEDKSIDEEKDETEQK